MTFHFRAHHPSAYRRFALFLLLLVSVNIIIIAIFFSYLRDMNEAATKSVVLIVPWMALLLLPSIVPAILIYRSFEKNYRFTFQSSSQVASSLIIEQLDKRGNTKRKTDFLPKEITGAQIVDFEDNHYCHLRFTERKHDLVIHRDTGDFENFLNALAVLAPDAIKIAD
jgi:hypothetical protein